MLISVVTPCLNRAAFVIQAIDSVQRQGYPHVEHIIVDGGSTDGTLELLVHYPHLVVSSQPDAGVYDALNRGIRLSHGQIIGFLNTDDMYEPDIFGSVAQRFLESPQIDAVVGGASIFVGPSIREAEARASFPAVGQGELLVRATHGAPVFNAWFFRRRLFDELGGFDERYLYVADRDLLIRMALNRTSYESLNSTVYHYRMHPGSFTLSGKDSGEADWMFECQTLAERYIQDRNAAPETLKCLREWHSQLTVEHMLTAWRKGALLRLPGYMLIGIRYNHSGWPRIFVNKAAERLRIFLGNTIRPIFSR